jgi:hypothetical protein
MKKARTFCGFRCRLRRHIAYIQGLAFTDLTLEVPHQVITPYAYQRICKEDIAFISSFFLFIEKYTQLLEFVKQYSHKHSQASTGSQRSSEYNSIVSSCRSSLKLI